ncbi:MAG: TIGR04283 family arsenosugar biosynthesis glycosyltransferase [Pseudomonadota bacterium]
MPAKTAMAVAAETGRLSIIVPTLNEAGTIKMLLTTLQPMRMRGHEVIVADGGSADETAGISLPLADHVIDSPRGRARQMQSGAAIASGDILWFLHADSHPPVNSDRIIQDTLQANSRHWGRFDVRFSGNGLRMGIVATGINLRSRITGIATGDQGIFVSRALFDSISGFPDIPLMEDIALSKRLKQHSRPVCLHTRLMTSPRRWQQYGYLRTVLLMWALRLGYFLGIPPAELARHYAQ